MKNEHTNHRRMAVLTGFISLAVISRVAAPPLLGHPANFSPIDAIALFSGAYFSRRWFAFLVPLLSVWVSDWFINLMYTGHFALFYSGFYWQYGTYVLLVLLGSLLYNKVKTTRVATTSLSASTLFFLISNFGVWASGYYPQSAAGLMTCYIAGIPFFGQTLISDLVYSAVLFSGFEWVKSRYPALNSAISNEQLTMSN